MSEWTAIPRKKRPYRPDVLVSIGKPGGYGGKPGSVPKLYATFRGQAAEWLGKVGRVDVFVSEDERRVQIRPGSEFTVSSLQSGVQRLIFSALPGWPQVKSVFPKWTVVDGAMVVTLPRSFAKGAIHD